MANPIFNTHSIRGQTHNPAGTTAPAETPVAAEAAELPPVLSASGTAQTEEEKGTNCSAERQEACCSACAGKDRQEQTEGCLKISRQYADVSLPIQMTPLVCAGCIETVCCGEPDVQCMDSCCGAGCEIIITQRLEIRIPIRFGVEMDLGESSIRCATCGGCCE